MTLYGKCQLRQIVFGMMFFACCFLAGCACHPKQAYIGDERPLSEVAVVRYDGPFRFQTFYVSIVPLLGDRDAHSQGLIFDPMNSPCFALLPGDYLIRIKERWQSTKYLGHDALYSYYDVSKNEEVEIYPIRLQAGYTYLLQGRDAIVSKTDGPQNNQKIDLARTATVTASSSADGTAPENVNTGRYSSWNNRKSNVWSADAKRQLPHWIQFQLQETSAINFIRLSLENYANRYPGPGNGAEIFIEVFVAGTWKRVAEKSLGIGRGYSIYFKTIRTDKVRVVFTKLLCDVAEVNIYNHNLLFKLRWDKENALQDSQEPIVLDDGYRSKAKDLSEKSKEEDAKQVKVTYRSDPPGGRLYELNGEFVGPCPKVLWYDLDEEAIANGYMYVRGLEVRWPSGPERRSSMFMTVKVDGTDRKVTFVQPGSEPESAIKE